MIGYESMSNSLIIVRSPSDSSTTSNEGYVFDFNTGGWSHSSSLIGDSNVISNFFHDWNNNLCVAFNTTEDETDIKKYLPVPLATTAQEIVTRDIDFGDPSTVKKIYAVTLTYKSSASQANPLKYAVNGKRPASYTSFATKTLGSTTDYDVATFTAPSPISCGSIQLKIELPSEGTFEINEMSIEYRVIRNKTVADG